ncbi:MAG: AAA family ATPase [Aliarcobacter sp.]|jgi:predicted ATPase|nr:AAA family ATPase [Aliarcobacter sp.]
MELVYLWVEEYKNIRNQGFNFSPRFECEYDGENLKVCDKKKNECKNNEYLENFFGKNTNVTAIVGENGSGKSGIIELLLEIITFNKNIETKYILIFDNNYFTNIETISCLNDNFKPTKKIQFFSILIDYGIDSLRNDNFRSDKHYIFENKKNYIFEPNKFSQNKANINIDIDNEKNRKRIIGHQKKLLEIKDIQKLVFIPTTVILRIDARRVFFNNGKKNNYKGDYFKNQTNLEKSILDLNKIYKNSSYANDDEKKKSDNVKSFLEKLSKVYTYSDNNCLDMNQTDNIKKQYGIRINFNRLDASLLNLIGNLPRYFLIDFLLDNGSNYSDLSTGEKQYQKIVYIIIDYISQSNKDNFLIFIDEVELYLHPAWQTKFIQTLINTLELLGKKYHLILTSHSPFILSDIPKENVIFLEKGKQVHPKIETFGANIHTLLSHGFFMSDGLMGEFAKSKIEEIKKFYELIQKLQKRGKIKNKNLWGKSYERRKTRFNNIQKIIGETFLQTIIKNYLDELEILFNGKKEFLDKEIKRLEELRKEI